MANRKHNNVWNESLASHISANKYGEYPGLSSYAGNMIEGTITWKRFETNTQFARAITPQKNSPIAAEYLTMEAYKEIQRITSEQHRHIREVWRSSAAVLSDWNPVPQKICIHAFRTTCLGFSGAYCSAMGR